MKIVRLLRQEFIQVLLLALPFALAAAWWDKIPPTVVSHWGFDGRPDGWMPKAQGVFLLPAFNVTICGVIMGFMAADRFFIKGTSTTLLTKRIYRVARWLRLGLTGFFATMSCVIIAVAAGWPINVGSFSVNAALVLLAAVGNFLANIQPNYFIGIRTPWTLRDADTWRATHRIGARVLVFGAVALLAVGLVVPDAVQLGLFLTFTVGTGLWGIGYSAWFYRTHPAGEQPHGVA